MKDKPQDSSRTGRLGAALRANLRRRKAAGKTAGSAPETEVLARRVDPLAPSAGPRGRHRGPGGKAGK